MKPIAIALPLDIELCNLPDHEFETGGKITAAVHAAGYTESGRVVVNNLRAWSMTVSEFAAHLTAQTEVPA